MVMSKRSAASRRTLSWRYCCSVMPANMLVSDRLASRTSQTNALGSRRGIQRDFRPLHRSSHHRILDTVAFDEINLPSEQILQIRQQKKVHIGEALALVRLKLDQKIKVAPRRVERVVDGGPNEKQPRNTVRAANFREFGLLVLNERDHA
jgi:hypothetical protein